MAGKVESKLIFLSKIVMILLPCFNGSIKIGFKKIYTSFRYHSYRILRAIQFEKPGILFFIDKIVILIIQYYGPVSCYQSFFSL